MASFHYDLTFLPFHYSCNAALAFFRFAQLGDYAEVFKRGDVAFDFAVCG